MARDLDDRVALFSNLGVGPVPARVQPGFRLGEFVEGIATLPQTTTVTCNDGVPGAERWTVPGQRGLFAFQWDAAQERYVWAVRPKAPIASHALPGTLAAAAAKLQFFTRFEQAEGVWTAIETAS